VVQTGEPLLLGEVTEVELRVCCADEEHYKLHTTLAYWARCAILV
jgi:hypothetical protein